MRKSLDAWHFCVEGENSSFSLARFLTAFEELRARLAPSRYPNIEISDEGHLWFNVDTAVGVVEILAFPFGFKEIDQPSIAVSLPRKAEDVDPELLRKLNLICESIAGVMLFANKTAATVDEILGAFEQDEHPSLTFTSEFDEILELKGKGVFFSYLGVYFAVLNTTVSETELTIREILSRLEGK